MALPPFRKWELDNLEHLFYTLTQRDRLGLSRQRKEFPESASRSLYSLTPGSRPVVGCSPIHRGEEVTGQMIEFDS